MLRTVQFIVHFGFVALVFPARHDEVLCAALLLLAAAGQALLLVSERYLAEDDLPADRLLRLSTGAFGIYWLVLTAAFVAVLLHLVPFLYLTAWFHAIYGLTLLASLTQVRLLMRQLRRARHAKLLRHEND